MTILDVAIVRHVGLHSSHFAVMQNTLANCLKQFILCTTGNVDLSKDFLHRNSNFMALNESKLGCSFLKRVFNKRNDVDGSPRIDFVKTINFFEDRFMA